MKRFFNVFIVEILLDQCKYFKFLDSPANLQYLFLQIAKVLKGRSEKMCRRLYSLNRNYLGMRRTSAEVWSHQSQICNFINASIAMQVLVLHMKDVYSMLSGL